MARSAQVIEDELQETIQQKITGLNSTSSTAIYKLWSYVVATAIHFLERLWDIYRAEVEQKIETGVWGTEAWYVEMAKKFQINTPLSTLVSGNEPYPPAVFDEEKQIIKRAAIRSSIGLIAYQDSLNRDELDINALADFAVSKRILTLKVAKIEANKSIKLSTDELITFTAYLEKIGPAGVVVNPVSLDADQLMIKKMSLLYDPIYTKATVLTGVKESIKAFLTSFANEHFDDVFYKNRLIQVIEAVPGVINVNADAASICVSTQADPIGTRYEMLAGYMELDEQDFDTQVTANTIKLIPYSS